MKFSTVAVAALAALLATSGALPALSKESSAATTIVYAISPDGLGAPLGSLTLRDTKRGLLIKPDLHGLPPGAHGFHLHENPDCSAGLKDGKMTAGLAAGGHFDPNHTGKHEGPEGAGHLGDLPTLDVGKDGTARHALIAPRLKLNDVSGHAFIVHEGGDNYSDDPKPLGGGGNRIACAVVL